MIIESILVGGAVLSAIRSLDKSIEMDKQTIEKYSKAFERNEEAIVLKQKKIKELDLRIANVAKKKRAIIQITVPKFIEVYTQIQKIELENKKSVNEIILIDSINKISSLNHLSLSVKEEITDKELVCGLLFKGFFKTMELDSERALSAAKNQLRQANVIYSQAQSMTEIYDAIIGRADRIAKMLMNLNALFMGAIKKCEEIISKNGIEVKNYSEFEKGTLMTCVNLAIALADLINIPVIDDQGKICESAIELLETGENYVLQMKNMI